MHMPMNSCMQPHAPAEVQHGSPMQTPEGLQVFALQAPPLPLPLPDEDPDVDPDEAVAQAPVAHVPPTMVQS